MTMHFAAPKPKGTTRTCGLCHTAASAPAHLRWNRRAWSFVHCPTTIREVTLSLSGVMALTAAIAAVGCDAAWHVTRAEEITDISARVIAINIPGASAISQVGTFLNV